MANKKITDLTELTAAASDDYLEIVDTSANASKKITRENLTGWHFLTSPLTSTAWDGAAFSTTAKTLIDLSTVFGAPAGVKAILVQLLARDSGSANSNVIFFGVGPNDVDASCPVMSVARGLPNDTMAYQTGIVPCNVNGDIYYQIVASGSGTMDCWIRIWGYWL
jgi:hypothetical protein